MRTLEDYLKENYEKNIIDHLIRATVYGDNVSIYIHANGYDSETLDYSVYNNILIPILNNRLTKV